MAARRHLGRAALQLAVTASLLGGLLVVLDAGDVARLLAAPAPGWLIAGLALSVPQVVLQALRWRFTAGRLGIPLSRRRAVAEYYLAAFLNQVLPGGVAGDVVRGWRLGRRLHHDGAQRRTIGRAATAVACERLAGQVAFLALLLAGLPFWPWPVTALAGRALAAIGVVALVGLVLAGLWRLPVVRASSPARMTAAALADGREALLRPTALAGQIAYSLPVLLSFLAVAYCAGRALGIALPPALLVTGVPLMLLAMIVPISVGGWGVREAAAAGAWTILGLPVSEAVALSLTYGLLVLAGSLPGLAVLAIPGRRPARRDAG